jgi:hypothetical protein
MVFTFQLSLAFGLVLAEKVGFSLVSVFFFFLNIYTVKISYLFKKFKLQSEMRNMRQIVQHCQS